MQSLNYKSVMRNLHRCGKIRRRIWMSLMNNLNKLMKKLLKGRRRLGKFRRGGRSILRFVIRSGRKQIRSF